MQIGTEKMTLRDILKRTKPTIVDLEYVETGPQWTCGSDVPVTWNTKDLKKCEKQCIRINYKNGYFTKGQYIKELRNIRKKYKRMNQG